MSQQELAEILGISVETVHQRETGKTRIKPESILAIQWVLLWPTVKRWLQETEDAGGDLTAGNTPLVP